MDPRSVVLYTVFPQLDALGVNGRARILGAFSSIQVEAEELSRNAFDDYRRIGLDVDEGGLAEHAQNQGIQYYLTLSELRQSVVNLLAVGLHHQLTGHLDQLKRTLRSRKQTVPNYETFSTWPPLEELRQLANTVKHGDGAELYTIRPDYFVHPSARDATPASAALKVQNAMGGTDLFVQDNDIDTYRDAIRAFWEEFLAYI